jgi:CheY-like chemotaxis protein
MRILLADDIEETRLVMRLVLEMKGHSVLEAVNGKAAVECALKEHPDLILMDLCMPVMDGLAATRRIRENAATALIPIFALSAHLGEPVWRDEALRAGCNQCYSKPLDFEALDVLLASVPVPPDALVLP